MSEVRVIRWNELEGGISQFVSMNAPDMSKLRLPACALTFLYLALWPLFFPTYNLCFVPSDLVLRSIKGVVYKIPCECGRVYVGETGRTLKQRMTEHKQTIRNADNNDGLAVHVAKTEHQIRWDEAEVVCREEQWTKHKIKEGLQIKAHAVNLNLDMGAFIDANWNSPS